MKDVKVNVYHHDIPESLLSQALRSESQIALDLETDPIDFKNDRTYWKNAQIKICTLYFPALKEVAVVRIDPDAPPENLKRLLQVGWIQKVLHHALFDLKFIYWYWGICVSNVACTKVLSKVTQPDRKSHSLQALLKEVLGVDIPKGYATSDWSAPELSPEQLDYVKNDVIHLPALFHEMWTRASDLELALVHQSWNALDLVVHLELAERPGVFSY